MKKLLIVIVLLGALSACSKPSSQNAREINTYPWPNVKFSVESKTDWVGSYNVNRIRNLVTWEDSGYYTPLEYGLTLGGQTVCFGWYNSKLGSTFRSDKNHQWVVVKQDGRSCLRLEKK